MSGNRRTVKSVTIEYESGDVETFQENVMWHVMRQNYQRKDTKPEQGFVNHILCWTDPDSMYPKGDGVKGTLVE